MSLCIFSHYLFLHVLSFPKDTMVVMLLSHIYLIHHFYYTSSTAALYRSISTWLRTDIIFSQELQQQPALVEKLQRESCESCKTGLPGW